MTGTNDKRADFQRMLKDSTNKAWDYVLVYKIDRFGRNKYEIAMNKHTLKANGIKLLSAMENIPDTPEGIILESLLEGMAEYYSAELAQKVRRGMNESRQKGQFTGGILPYGYKVEGKKIVIDNDAAEVVRFIFEQYSKDMVANEISQILMEKGITYRGKPFAKYRVYKILQNTKYSGIYHHGDEIFTNIYPAIVSKEIFEKVQIKNKNNRYGSKSEDVKYLLRKKIICGYCGSTINGISATSKSKKKKRYYCCSGRYLRKSCTKKYVRKDALENAVVQALMSAFDDTAIIDRFADKIIAVYETKQQNQAILTLLLQEQNKIIKAKNNILAAIEEGVITNTTKERLQELEAKQEELSDKIALEQSKAKTTIRKENIVAYIKQALKNKAERLLDLLVRQIVLYDDKIIIRCKYTDSGKDEPLDDVTLCSTTTEIPVINTCSPMVKTEQIKVEITA